MHIYILVVIHSRAHGMGIATNNTSVFVLLNIIIVIVIQNVFGSNFEQQLVPK